MNVQLTLVTPVIVILLVGMLGADLTLVSATPATKIISNVQQDKPKISSENPTNTLKPLTFQKQSCTNPEYLSYKNQLDVASKKVTALKESLYRNLQLYQKADPGSIKAKLDGSPEMQNYLQLQKKIDTLYSACMSYAVPTTMPVIPTKICTDADYSVAQKNIADIDKKYSELKQKYLDEGKTAYASGQYSGRPEQYAQDKLVNSDEIKKLQESRQKYELATRDCQQNYLPRPAIVQSQSSDTSNSCQQSDIDNLKLAISDLEKSLSNIKEKTNPEWRALHDSGKIKEDWPEYAKKIAQTSPEFATYQQLQQKLDTLNKICNTVRNVNTNSNSSPSAELVCTDDAKKARQLLEDAQNKYAALKTKYYEDWKSQSNTRTYLGTWDQFAQEKFLNAPEVTSINQLITKYSVRAQDCLYPTQVNTPKSYTTENLKQITTKKSN